MNIELVDVAILGIIGLSIITGLFRGFTKEFISLCVWVLSFWLAYQYADDVSQMIAHLIADPKVRITVAAVGIVISTLIAGGICNWVLSFILTKTGLSSTDRLLGMGFGLLRGVLIVAVIILGLNIMKLPINKHISQSVLYDKFTPLVTWMEGYLPEIITKMGKVDPLKESNEKAQENVAEP